jgi:hypothetical protein
MSANAERRLQFCQTRCHRFGLVHLSEPRERRHQRHITDAEQGIDLDRLAGGLGGLSVTSAYARWGVTMR